MNLVYLQSKQALVLCCEGNCIALKVYFFPFISPHRSSGLIVFLFFFSQLV